jgi:HEAT repeat protein
MNKYERYSSRELLETAKAGPANLRNYLIGLLLQREDREQYISEVLRGGDSPLLRAVLRSLSPVDVKRFQPDLERYLADGDADIKRTIVANWGQAREKNAIPRLLGLVKDGNEDQLLKKMAIFSLGEIGDIAAFSPLSTYLDAADVDIKIAVLIALNKINREDAQPLFLKASKDQSPDVRYWAENFLKHAGGGEMPDDRSIQHTWTRDPASFHDRDRLSFSSNGEGRYEEDKAREVTLLIRFRYRLEPGGNIVFVSRGSKEYATGYQVREGQFRHSYEGNINCLILEFADKNIQINRTLLTGTPYYFFAKGVI